MDLAAEPILVQDDPVAMEVDAAIEPERNVWETDVVAGVIKNLANYLSLAEIKTLRRVSKIWNDTLKIHHRFTDSAVRLNDYWVRQVLFLRAPGIQIQNGRRQFRRIRNEQTLNMPKWTSAKLKGIALGRKTVFMRTLWRPQYEMTMKKVEIQGVRIQCTAIMKLIKAMPRLEELTLRRILFTLINNMTNFQNAGGATQPIGGNFVPVPLHICCSHVDLLPDAAAAVEITRTIRKVTFIEVNVIPTCLLLLLQRRCNTVLQEFEYRDALMGLRQRSMYGPTKNFQDANVRRLLSENVGTLTKFIWKNNGCGNAFINDPVLRNMNLLRELALGQPKYLNLEDPGVRSGQVFMSLLREPRIFHPQTGLTKLELGLNGPFNMNDLLRDIQRMTQLESLTLRFRNYQSPSTLRLDFRLFERLHSLEISQSENMNHILQVDGVAEDHLPNTLRALVLNTRRSVNLQKLNGLLTPHNHRDLTKLMIGQLNGTDINDDAIQLLISELPLLEDLSVTEAVRVTDYGLTGLPIETVNMIIKTRSYSLIFGKGCHIQSEGTRNLSELKYLRRLNLSGCRQVSDVSIALAFILPHLREIDLSYMTNVTDFGIMYLTKNNRSLEKIVLKYNNKVSHFGINQLVKHCKSLVSVTISHSVNQRRFNSVPYDAFTRLGFSKVKFE